MSPWTARPAGRAASAAEIPQAAAASQSAFRSVECAWPLQDRVAPPPVFDRDLDRAHEHQHEAEQHRVVDEAFLKLDGGHPLVADDLDELPDQLDRIAEERDPDRVDHCR